MGFGALGFAFFEFCADEVEELVLVFKEHVTVLIPTAVFEFVDGCRHLLGNREKNLVWHHKMVALILSPSNKVPEFQKSLQDGGLGHRIVYLIPLNYHVK